MTFKVLFEDAVGESKRPTGPLISDLKVDEPLRNALIQSFGDDIHLSPPQAAAMEQGVTSDSSHFLISAPTNSGKTLIALLRIFERAIEKNARSVLVVPLKAIAEEKAEEIRHLAQLVVNNGGPELKVHITTGDYQLSGDFLGSSPPEQGEIIVCTPERLDVILRNPDNQKWAESIDTYVLDEFHLIGESGRGAGMEALVTRLLVYLPESSIMALSATIGGISQIAGWLEHMGHEVHVLESNYRYPKLVRSVVEVDQKDEFVLSTVQEIINEPERSLLVFVYRKGDAEKLAIKINSMLPEGESAAHFHSGLPIRDRLLIGQNFRDRKIRFLVTTTSLKMGVNTPATDVVIRDTIFHGVGQLQTVDILQMLGRAGRGNYAGHGTVLCTSKEDASKYVHDLEEGIIEAIKPQMIIQTDAWSRNKSNREAETDPVKAVVLGEIARLGYTQVSKLQDFIAHSYSGWMQELVELNLDQVLASLVTAKLIYKVENSESTYSATKLGKTTVFAGLSPESGGMLGGFIRALINLGSKHKELDGNDYNYLRRLGDIDLLFLAAASFEARRNLLKNPSKAERGKIAQYIEQLDIDDKPLINLWRSSNSKEYPTRRILSSLRFSIDSSRDDLAEATFNKLMGTAILLHRHAKGEKIETLASEYSLHEGTLENGLKFTVLWVLSCLAQICSSDRCYKLDFLAMRIYELLEDLTLGSTLGKLLTVKGIGRKSVQKLINAGFDDIGSLTGTSDEIFLDAGLVASQAKSVKRFVRRRSR